MSLSNPTHISVQDAQAILKPFNCIENTSINSASEKALIQQALLVLAENSDYQILGICADTMEQALLALKTYTEALGYQLSPQLDPIEGPVYLKFNPKSGLCYLDSYTGTHRGVLVSCQSAYEGRINEMYGHLPLDLFISESYIPELI
ncbi:MAG TPA: DUF1824 family protein [Cyanophyceae cyanobacterium]